MNTQLPEFEKWARQRITLKHNWFDRLADVVRSFPLGEDLPASLKHWDSEYGNLVKWIGDAVIALSPRQFLALPEFGAWPEGFRRFYTVWLHEQFLKTKPNVQEIVAACHSELKKLDSELQQILQAKRPVFDTESRAKIAGMLETIARRLRDLPETVQWPEFTPDDLPDVLVIDDLLGRAANHKNGQSVLSKVANAQILELRRSFCQRFRLLDDADAGGSKKMSNPIARAHFSTGQSYDDDHGFINDLDVVRRSFHQGGVDNSAGRWSLVIADVLFNTGKPDENGKGDGESKFGVDEVVPWLKSVDSRLPIVALTTESGHSLIERVYELGVDYLHRTESTYVDMLTCMANGGRVTAAQLKRAMGVPLDLIAEDPLMINVLVKAWNTAQDESGPTVLITGQPGAGKDRLANYIHKMSPRGGRDLVTVNCAQYSKELADTELFGYYAGAFTGAANVDTQGVFHKADKSTLVLDEFADLDGDVQVKLLLTLEPNRAQERPVEPRGNRRLTSKLPTTVDVRVICCTNQPISNVRDDLRSRVREEIEIPPLRQRPADVVALAHYFLTDTSRIGAPGLSLDESATRFLKTCSLPGNARTLEQLLKAAIVGKGKRNIIRSEDLKRAWRSVFKEESPDGRPAVFERAMSPTNPAQPFAGDELSKAVSFVLSTVDHEQWRQLSKADTDSLDEALNGQMIDVISILLEWSLFRANDVPAIYSYVTGQRARNRVPEDLIKRLLKLDQKIVDSIARSPYLPSNTRLKQLVDSCREDWARRTKAAAQS